MGVNGDGVFDNHIILKFLLKFIYHFIFYVVKILRPHWYKRVKTFEEGQLICSKIQKLATKIDELNKDIKLCDFIENNTLKMKDNIKEINQEENNKIKVKRKDVYDR